MRVVIAGGTGLIGRALAASLAADEHDVVLLSRAPGNAVSLPEGVKVVYWDTGSTELWAGQLDGAGAVINLAGESIGGSSLLTMRWTGARKRRILSSRVRAGAALVEAIKLADRPPSVLIQSSAVGYYGTHEDDREITESSPAGEDFLARVCLEWEASTKPVEALDVRRVVIRSGVVLDRHGGALPRQALPFRLFVGGRAGSGRQWYSWIHVADEVAAIRFLLENESASGAYNLTAPGPVRNEDFSKALGKALGRPAYLPMPTFALRLGLGEASATILSGQRVIPRRLTEAGFTFQFADVESALKDIFK